MEAEHAFIAESGLLDTSEAIHVCCLSFIFHFVNLTVVLKANFLEWMSPDDFDCQSVYACTSDASSARWCKQVSNKICVGGSVDLKVTMMLTMSMTMMMMMTALIMIVAFHLVMMVPPVSSFLSSPFPPSRPPAGSQNSEEPQMDESFHPQTLETFFSELTI